MRNVFALFLFLILLSGEAAGQTLQCDLRVYTAETEWTFPLEFAELVWSDGSAIHRQIISATELGPFGHHTFRVPFDVAGKKWVRFAVWDSAGNGAFTQPVSLKKTP